MESSAIRANTPASCFVCEPLSATRTRGTPDSGSVIRPCRVLAIWRCVIPPACTGKKRARRNEVASPWKATLNTFQPGTSVSVGCTSGVTTSFGQAGPARCTRGACRSVKVLCR